MIGTLASISTAAQSAAVLYSRSWWKKQEPSPLPAPQETKGVQRHGVATGDIEHGCGWQIGGQRADRGIHYITDIGVFLT
jgi:hypothetical protein